MSYLLPSFLFVGFPELSRPEKTAKCMSSSPRLGEATARSLPGLCCFEGILYAESTQRLKTWSEMKYSSKMKCLN